MILACAFLTGLWTPHASAQTPDGWEWSTTIATNNTEFASDVAVDSLNGAVYTAGQAENGFSGILGGLWTLLFGNNTESDGYLVKQDLNGTVQWLIVVGGAGDDAITGVCTDVQGHVYVTGYFSGSDASFTGVTGSSQTLSSNGGTDIFTACYSATGELLWKIKGGGSGNDKGTSICHANGQVFVGGSYSGQPVNAGSNNTFPSGGSATAEHAFLCALQATVGSIDWLASGSNGASSSINAIASDGSQVYALGVHAGTSYAFTSSADPTALTLATTGNNLSADVLAISATGELNWAQAVANPGGDTIQALGLACSPNAVFISGSTHDASLFPGPLVVSPTGDPHDYGYLAKLSKNTGLTQWVRTFISPSGHGHDQVGRGIALDAHGDVLLSGSYKENIQFPDGTQLSGDDDLQVFIAKFKGGTGTLNWAITATGEEDDQPNGVAVDATGGVYLAGSYEKDIQFDADWNDHPSANLFTAKLHDLDFDVTAFHDPSAFMAPAPMCSGNAPMNLAYLLIPERSGTGSAVYSSSGIDSNSPNGPAAALGRMPGGVAVFDDVSDQIVIDLHDTIPPGEQVIIRWRSTGGAASMNVQGAMEGAGTFTDQGTINTGSTAMVLEAVTATVPMRFLKLTRTGSSTCEVDGVYYNFGSAPDGHWSGGGVSGSSFDPSGLSGNVAITYTASGNSTTHTVTISPESVAGTLSGGGIICPGSDAALELTGSIGSIVWQRSTDGGNTWASNPSGLAMDTLFHVTQTTVVQVQVTSGTCPAAFSDTVQILPLDTVPPVIFGCPGDISVNGFTDNSVVTWTEPTVSDNCTGASIFRTAGPGPGSSFTMGNTAVAYEATDGAGNTASCSFSVTVSFRDPSAFSPPGPFCAADAPVDLTTYLLPTAQGHGASISSSSGVSNPSAALGSGNYGAGALFDDPGDELIMNLGTTLPPGGSVVIRWRAVSGSAVLNVGGSASGTGSFNDLGEISTASTSMTFTPVATTTATQYLRLRRVGGNDFRVDAVLYDIGSDAGGTWSGPGVIGQMFNPAGQSGGVNITYTANGHSTTNAVTVSPESVAGTLSGGGTICPGSDAAFELVGSQGSILWQRSTDGGNTWASNPSGLAVDTLLHVTQSTVVRAQVGSGTCPVAFSDTVHVVPLDTVAPVITGCPGDITAYTSSEICSAEVHYALPTVTDECSVSITLSQNAGTASGSSFPLGNTQVIFTATDLSGNASTCAFSIEVLDTVPPSAGCQPITAYLDASGHATISADQLDNGSSDNCTLTGVALTTTQYDATGTYTDTLIATDASGNVDSCFASITVVDTIAPTVACSGPINALIPTGQCSTQVFIPHPQMHDNSGTVTLTDSSGTYGSGSWFPAGTNSVTYTVTDPSGHSATCTLEVDVTASPAPVLSYSSNAFCNSSPTVLPDASTPDNGTFSCASSGLALDVSSGAIDPQASTPGQYEVTYGFGGPCPVHATFTLEIEAAPSAGSDAAITLCTASGPTDLFPLLGSDAQAGGTWSSGNGSYVPANDDPGIFTYTVSGGAACADAQASVTVSETTAPYAGADSSIMVCGNGTAIDLASLLPGADTGGTWSNGSGQYDPATDDSGTFTYTVGDGVNCPVDNATITVSEQAPPDAGSDAVITLCEAGASTDLFTLLGSDAQAGGTWSSGNGSYDPATDDPGSFTYTVSGGAACADAQASVTVSESAAPYAGADSSITLCENSAAMDLMDLLPDADTGGSWSNGSGHYNPATDAPGSFTYSVGDGVTCPVDQASITVNEQAAPSAGSDAAITLCEAGAPTDLFALLGSDAQTGGTWNPGDGSYDPATDDPGSFTYTVSGGATCADAQATVTVSESAAPYAGADNNITVCGNGTAIDLDFLLPGADAGGTWSNGSGQYSPTTDAPGTFTYTVGDGVSCPVDNATITVSEQAPPDAGSDAAITLCANADSLNLLDALGGSPESNGQWHRSDGNLFDGFFNPATDTADVFTYTVDGAAPCFSASSTVTVTLSAPPSAAWSSPAPVCHGAQPIDLGSLVTGTSGGSWSGPGVTADGQHFDPGAVSPQGNEADFTLTYAVSTNGCSASQNGSITVLASPEADAGPDGAACALEYELQASLNVGTGTWSAASGITFADVHAPGTVVHVPGPGTYTLGWTVANGQCSSTDSTLVTFHIPNELTVLDAGPDQEQNITRSATLQGSVEGATEIIWNVISGSGILSDPGALTTAIDNLANGSNLVMLSARVGACPFRTDTVAITVNGLFIPSGFSPNGDGVNDTFFITGLETLTGNELTVFDRWGQPVYHAQGYANDWDGRGVNGRELNDGTYFYVLNFSGGDPYHGQIIIKR